MGTNLEQAVDASTNQALTVRQPTHTPRIFLKTLLNIVVQIILRKTQLEIALVTPAIN